jgi:hypothetical protein
MDREGGRKDLGALLLLALMVNDLKCGHFLPSNRHVCPEW